MTNNTQPLLTPREAASYLNIAVGTLSNWRHLKRHDLPFLRMGNRIRYKLKDLEAFMSVDTVMDSISKRKHKKPPVVDYSVIQQYGVDGILYDVGYDKNGKIMWKRKSKEEK